MFITPKQHKIVVDIKKFMKIFLIKVDFTNK